MSTLGFEEAHKLSLTVKLSTGLEVQVSAPQSPAILKLISWDERAEGKSKDAEDFLLTMRNYIDFGNVDRLAGSDVLDEDFDYEVAGARLPGRDMRMSCADATEKQILKILGRREGTDSEKRWLE